MLEAVFFDLDDTLCNTSVSRFDRARLVANEVRRHDNTLSLDELVSLFLEPIPGTPWPQGPRPHLEKLGILDSDAGRVAHCLWFFEGCEHLLCAYDGRDDSVRELASRYRLGVITNGSDSIQRRKFEALGLSQHFDIFVTSEAVGAHKPEAAIFRHALDKLGIDASRAAFVGDMPEIDVLGAQQSGMRGVWFNPGGIEPHATIVPDATVTSYTELPWILRSL